MTSTTHNYNPNTYYTQNSVLSSQTVTTVGGEIYRHILPSDFSVSSNQNNDNPLVRKPYRNSTNYSQHRANNHLLEIYTRSDTKYSRYTLTSSLVSIDREQLLDIFEDLSITNEKDVREMNDILYKLYDFIINNESMHEIMLKMVDQIGTADIASINNLKYSYLLGTNNAGGGFLNTNNQKFFLDLGKESFATVRDSKEYPFTKISKLKSNIKSKANISESCELYKITTQIWSENQNMMRIYATLIINNENVSPTYNVLFFDKQNFVAGNIANAVANLNRELLSHLEEHQNVIPVQTNYIPSIEFDRTAMNTKFRLNVTYPEYDINIYNKPEVYCMIPLPTKTNGIKLRLNGVLGIDQKYTDNKRIYVYEVYMNEDEHKVTNEILKGKINDEIVINNHFLSQPIVTNYTQKSTTENKHGNYILIEIKAFNPITDYIVGGYVVYK